MSRRTRGIVGAAVLTATAAIGAAVVGSGAHGASAAARLPASATAAVQRRTLSATVSEPGILTYRALPDGSPYTVIAHSRGTYTQLPAAGAVIAQGHVLYRVDNRPVVLLQGATPAYRTLTEGLSGPDVAELNADLVALGDAGTAQLRPRSRFTAATAAAVERLQAAVGAPQTGALTPRQVVFEPSSVRVTRLTAQLGTGAVPGAVVLDASSRDHQVQVALDASQQGEVAAGDEVTITLPDSRTTPGVVTSVSKVATCPAGTGGGSTGTGSGSAGAAGDACPAAGSGGSAPTIAVDVRFSRPAAGGSWDQAPVQVGITTATARAALTVPVTSLLARAGSGYAVEIAGGNGKRRLVPVALGLFDDAAGLVQVTGSGLAAGDRVVVPST